MAWFPIGPDSVFTPRKGAFTRLSRRNELGRQGLAESITVDQTDPDYIYVVDRPSSGGTAAFRTENGGRSWKAISDSLNQTSPRIDPMWIAVNPDHPETIYLVTYWDRGLYISGDRGDTWGAKTAIPDGTPVKIIVDPRYASDLAHVHLIVATSAGVYYSANSGVSWTQVAAGEAFSLAACVPASGTAHFLAGLKKAGVFYATDPSSPWTNLNTKGIGLPPFAAGDGTTALDSFHHILVDVCPLNPGRAYAWLAKPSGKGNEGPFVTAGIYTTSSPSTAWTAVAAASPPDPAQGWYNYSMAAAPNSPGDGANDILFFGRIELFRSLNGGATWVKEGNGFHADQHGMAFYPERPGGGTIPVAYFGCDGGIGKSTRYCDPAYDIGAVPSYFNEGSGYSDTGTYQNLNHARQASALYQYASHSSCSALGYIGCQDTGVAGGVKALGWRGLVDADGGAVAIAPGSDGVKVWGTMGFYGNFPSFRVLLWTDRGGFVPSEAEVKLGSSAGVLVNNSSNFELTPGDGCLTGAYVRDPETTLSGAITHGAGGQTATPASMASITVDVILTVDEGDRQEDVRVTAVTASTFEGVFTRDHASGARVWVNRTFVARLDTAGIAHQISQDFSASTTEVHWRKVGVVACHFTDPGPLLCSVNKENDNRVFYTHAGSTATSATVWKEAADGKPAGVVVHGLAITPDADMYVLLRNPATHTPPGGAVVVTPLFRLSEGVWLPQVCAGNPANDGPVTYGRLLAHPTRDDRLYASHGARVYELRRTTANAWSWTDISEGLPGQYVYDLWIGFCGPDKTESQVILRAGIPTRGVWECQPHLYGEGQGVHIYMRDHPLDQGLLNTSEDGLANPYDPTQQVWHYQSADIKMDARQPASGGAAAYYQTDPEGGSPPLSHVLFDQLQDHSQSLQSENDARVHVQVHNRDAKPTKNINVWAICCNAAAGVPSLAASPSSGNAFPFWSQFQATGDIIPALPADSPWTSIGAPVTLAGLAVDSPQVASWDWQVPDLATGDPGHYCLVAFVHGVPSPMNETGLDVDTIVRKNRLIAQKNLHIGPPLTSSGTGGGGAPSPGGPFPRMNEYVEFHNPGATPRTVDLLFDLRSLPHELAVTLQFGAAMETAEPLGQSVAGIRNVRPAGPDEAIRAGGDPSWSRMLRGFPQLCRWINLLLRLLGIAPLPCGRLPRVPMPEFGDRVYEAAPGERVVVRGVRLAAFGSAAAFLRVRHTGGLPKGSRYGFEVQQFERDRVVGGSTYSVVIEGLPDVPPPIGFRFVEEGEPPENWDRIEREAKDLKYMPPWAREISRDRERERGK